MFFSLSVLKLFVLIEVIKATRALGGLVFIRINSFQPSLKMIFNLSRFQPLKILKVIFKIQTTRGLLMI